MKMANAYNAKLFKAQNKCFYFEIKPKKKNEKLY